MAKGPGKYYRKGISLFEVFDEKFPDELTAERWFAKMRWGSEPCCPHCGSLNVLSGAKHHSMPYRCREKGCRKRFSVRIGTPMQDSNIPLRKWAIAIYLMTTNLKGVSSMKLSRDLGIAQSSAWHLAHRLREAWAMEGGMFAGPAEVDETYVGGKEANKHWDKRLRPGGGTGGKKPVVGIKDRETNQIVAQVTDDTEAETLQRFVRMHVDEDAIVITDGSHAYIGLPNHRKVYHSMGQYVDGMAHTNGIESFWAMLKRGYHGVYHRMSFKHLQRYVDEFAGRHNLRPLDTTDQMHAMVQGMEGRRLPYRELVA